MPIQASIGKYHYGAKQCYNLPKDQLHVANLLDLVGKDQGGTDGALLLGLDSFRWGLANEQLYKAIQVFQNKQFGSSDGHVDPGEKTIRRLEALAFAQDAPSASNFPGPSTPNTPNRPSFNTPSPDNLPNPNNPVLEWAGKTLDTLGFAGSMIDLIFDFVLADVFGNILAVISTILSLPAAWDSADRKAKFNGYCSGFWNAMQDMADAFKSDALDSLIRVSITPPDAGNPVGPASNIPVTWPTIPQPAPHITSLNEASLMESERQNRVGEREGCQKAYDYIMGLERNPQTLAWFQDGHNYKVDATGKVMLRLLYKGAKGQGVASLIRSRINEELKKKGQGEWPIWK